MKRSGFHLLMGAQFVSGLTDNALLLVAIAQVAATGGPLWLPPLLKLVFTLAYVLLALYGLAALLNLGVPDSGARYPAALPLAHQLRAFRRDNARLWRDPLGQVSLATTTLFWGVGATLQFLVLR